MKKIVSEGNFERSENLSEAKALKEWRRPACGEVRKYSNTALRQYGMCGIIRAMKATMQIPDEMYREVKAKSALQGRSVRSVTIMLYTNWLRGLVDESGLESPIVEPRPATGSKPNLACFGVGRRFVRKNADGPHDMASLRESIAAGRKMS